MGVEALTPGLIGSAAFIAAFGLAFIASALKAQERYDGRGLIAVWLGATVGGAVAACAWLWDAFPGFSLSTMLFFLVPFLFLLIQLGLVVLYLSRSARRERTQLHRLAMGFAVFTLAAIPAFIVSLVLDIFQLLNKPL
jgi:cytochrome bd-type quinol oxidase subunit 2